MWKKIIIPVLILSFLLPMVPVQAQGAEIVTDDELESLIAEQFDAFVATLNPQSASEAATALVNHSMRSSATWHMTTEDEFAKGLFSTELVRTSLIQTAAMVHQTLSDTHDDYVSLWGCHLWYANNLYYSNTAYSEYNGSLENSTLYSPVIQTYDKNYSGPVNSYDEAMILVAGTSESQTSFQVVSVTEQEVTYHVTLKVEDTFDFGGASYSGSDHGLEIMLTWMGRLLSFGLLKTFDWTAVMEFDLTLPNFCTHESGNYRWEFDGLQDLVSVEADSNISNPLTRIETEKYEGGFSRIYYTAQRSARLYHDRPWCLEFRCAGTGYFCMANHHSSSTAVYLRRTPDTLFFGEPEVLDKAAQNILFPHYGVPFARDASVDGKQMHTYLLMNRVNEDGSNMVYLYLDGVDLGPMNQYYLSSAEQYTTIDWVNGKDFIFNYVGNKSWPVTDLSIEYIQVWENGEGKAPFSYLTDEAVAPSCTEAGYTRRTCSLCGAVFADEATDPIPATGHLWDDGTVTAEPTTEQEGELRYTCTACGETRTEVIPSIPHTHVYGEWETVVEASGKAEGQQRRYCHCGEFESRLIPKLENPFSDVADDEFYYEPVLWAVRKGITTGASATIFSPHETCTRAQVVTFLWRAMGKPGPESVENPFEDVTPDAYYYDAVLWAVEQGITTGTSGTTFSPGEHCTRGQVVTFLWRALGREEAGSSHNPFRDVGQDAYYNIPVLWAVENSITSGTTQTTFSPEASCIRSQVVTFLYRAMAQANS